MKRLGFFAFVLSALPVSALSKFTRKGVDRTTRGFRVRSGEARFGKHYAMKGVTLNVLDNKISSDDTGGDIAVFEQNGHTPKGGPPLHIHLYQDEFFYIIEGDYLFQVGDEKYPMKPGDTIFLPRGVPHAFVQLTDKARVLVSYLPAGKMENFFRLTDSWVTPPTQVEVSRAFEDHDMKIVGPPLSAD